MPMNTVTNTSNRLPREPYDPRMHSTAMKPISNCSGILSRKENIRVVMMQLGYMSRLDSMSTAKVAYTISGFSVIRRTPGVTP